MSPRTYGLIATALVVAAVVTAPAAVAVAALRALDDTACAGDGPPSDAFYRAVSRLDGLARLPWIRPWTEPRVSEVASGCQGAFEDACDALRDHAVTAARAAVDARFSGQGAAAPAAADWASHIPAEGRDRLCTDWAAWRQWLAAQGLDPAAACAVCGGTP